MTVDIKRTKLISGVVTVVVLLMLSMYFIKPKIDNYFGDKIESVAIETCGGKDRVKKVTSDGFECK